MPIYNLEKGWVSYGNVYSPDDDCYYPHDYSSSEEEEEEEEREENEFCEDQFSSMINALSKEFTKRDNAAGIIQKHYIQHKENKENKENKEKNPICYTRFVSL